MSELTKAYDPKKVEKAVASRWEKEEYGNPDKLPERHKQPFAVMYPPPNVTGSLHMGHALEAALSDCLLRRKRMQGYKVLWLLGLDHASIAVHNVIERELKKEGKTRFELGREKFLKRAWEWKEKYGGIILEQFKRIGVSGDWSRARFTMDPEYTKAVEKTFKHYHEKGWIYKGTRVVNWCPRCKTPLSDLELEYKEENGALWHIRYPLKKGGGSIVVATTRPETMLGDTAVAVHPEDERYKNLIGENALLPLANREIPIIADAVIDREFGTGAVKVTPAHDLTDAEIGERHKLASITAIGPNGRMTEEVPEPYRGLKTKEAREAVLRDLQNQNFIEKIEDYQYNIAICYRCGTAVEPMPSKQWFLKMSELAQLAASAYNSGKVRLSPEKWNEVALRRLLNERDWCISRQLWWGHKIPLENEEDILDTWFSSALWPFAALGWPENTRDFKTYYPNHWMTSGRDILFLWINRMVFSGLEFTNKEPFPEAFIHPTVLTKEGKRMSKSLGTGIDPLELIERYGADALRFGLLWQLTGVQDIRFDESAILAGKKFLNKLWNASRYALTKAEGSFVPETQPISHNKEDNLILEKLNAALAETNEQIEALRFGQALETFYTFFWHALCDQYLEQTKQREDEITKEVLLWTLSVSLKVLHPFIPFITDELWHKLPHKTFAPITIAQWPN